MRFCPRCKKEVFAGSICHVCASELIEKDEVEETLGKIAPAPIFFKRKKPKLRRGFSQTLIGRCFQLVLEVAIFCALFVGATFAFMQISDWLSDLMESKLRRFDVFQGAGIRNPIRYFWYTGCVIVAVLTVKYRFHRD